MRCVSNYSFFLGVLFLTACGEVSYVIKNEVIVLSPQWSLVGEQLNWIDRTIGIFETNTASIKNELIQAARVDNEDQKDHAQQQIELFVDKYQQHFRKFKQTYQRLRKTYTRNRIEFNELETSILSDKITNDAEATLELNRFRRRFKDLSNEVSTVKIQLQQEIKDYNENIRELAESMEVYTSYEIILK